MATSIRASIPGRRRPPSRRYRRRCHSSSEAYGLGQRILAQVRPRAPIVQPKRLELGVRLEELALGERARGAPRVRRTRTHEPDTSFVYELLLVVGEDGRAAVGVGLAVGALGRALGTAPDVDPAADEEHVRPTRQQPSGA